MNRHALLILIPIAALMLFAPAPATPHQQTAVAPVLHTFTVPVDRPGLVTFTIRANGGHTVDFEPRDDAPPPLPPPAPAPRPEPTPSPTPGPQGDLEHAAAAYFAVLPSMLNSVAREIEIGRVKTWNGAMEGINVARRVVADTFGDALDTAAEKSGGLANDDEGTITDPAAIAAVLRRAAEAR